MNQNKDLHSFGGLSRLPPSDTVCRLIGVVQNSYAKRAKVEPFQEYLTCWLYLVPPTTGVFSTQSSASRGHLMAPQRPSEFDSHDVLRSATPYTTTEPCSLRVTLLAQYALTISAGGKCRPDIWLYTAADSGVVYLRMEANTYL